VVKISIEVVTTVKILINGFLVKILRKNDRERIIFSFLNLVIGKVTNNLLRIF